MIGVLKDFFFEEDEQAPAKPTPEAPVLKVVKSNGKISSGAYKMLIQVAEKVPTPALDSLKAALEAAADSNIPEATRYSFAFKMLAKMSGLTKEALLAELTQKLQIVQEQESVFAGKVEQKKNESLGAKQEELSAIAPRIAELKEQISKLEKQEMALGQEIAAEQRQIETAKQDFQDALNQITSELKAEQVKLTQYLK